MLTPNNEGRKPAAMDIVFFGSSQFAVQSLEALVRAGHTLSLVVTQPDRPKGRRLFKHPTEIALKAKALGLAIFQPHDPNTPEALEWLKKRPVDLYVVASYGHILTQDILNLPRLMAINIHASLLPKYRGAAPIHWAIIKGEKETGISIIKMIPRMDAGDILLQKKINIENIDTAQSLSGKLELLASESILDAVKLLEKNQQTFIKQDETQVSYAPKLQKEHCLINWNDDASTIAHHIRGLSPSPAAYTYRKEKMIKIFTAKALDYPETKPALVLAVSKKMILIGCKEGAIEIFELQQENGKRISAEAFSCGYKIHPGEQWG